MSFSAVLVPLRNHRRAALLLTVAQSIRKCVVGIDVIHLGGGLVVPAAPGLAAVDRNDRALIAAQDDHIRIDRIDPDVLIVVAAGRAAKGRPRLATVSRLPGYGACDNHDLR